MKFIVWRAGSHPFLLSAVLFHTIEKIFFNVSAKKKILYETAITSEVWELGGNTVSSCL